MNACSLTSSTRVQRTDSLLFTRVDAEFLAIDAKRGECYSFNETAKRLWEVLVAPATVADLCRNLQAEYAVTPETCEAEVIGLLGQLHEAGLVDIRNDG